MLPRQRELNCQSEFRAFSLDFYSVILHYLFPPAMPTRSLETISHVMNVEWREKPATEEQKVKLRFYQCTWDEGITAGQAADALEECARNWPTAELEFQKSQAATDEQKRKLNFFGCSWEGEITIGQANEALAECIRRWPAAEQAWVKHNLEQQTKPVPPVLEANRKPVEFTTISQQEPPSNPDQPRHEGFFCGDTPAEQTAFPATNVSARSDAALDQQREKIIRQIEARQNRPAKPPIISETPAAALSEGLKNARGESEPETPSYLSYPPEPRHQDFDSGLSFVIATTEWVAMVKKIEAENRRRFEAHFTALKLWRARFNWNETKETPSYPKPPLPYDASFPEVTIQPAAPRPSRNPNEFTIPAREVQEFAHRQSPVRKPAEYHIAQPIQRFEQWLDNALKKNQTCMGGHWLPIGPLNHIFDSSGITVDFCRQIAEVVESRGYCVEPEPRFGNGPYERDQTIALFKPVNGEGIKPSQAYLGAANLLRLCVLIAAADGQIETGELDAFRPAIETLAGLTKTDRKRLIVLEQLLAQELCPASKAIARIAKSISPTQRLVVAKLLVDVAAANNFITQSERKVLERVFKEFSIPVFTLDSWIRDACSGQQINIANGDTSPQNKFLWEHWRRTHPGVVVGDDTLAGKSWNLTDWRSLNTRWLNLLNQLTYGFTPIKSSVATPSAKATRSPTARQIKSHVPVAKPPEFTLDMEKVSVITKETKEAIAILSVIMDDESENQIKLPQPAVEPTVSAKMDFAPEAAAPKEKKYEGLDPKFEIILDRLLAKNAWPAADFSALAREFDFMPLMISDTLNAWSDEMLGDFILEGDDPVQIRRELLKR